MTMVKSDKVFVSIDGALVELTGADKQAFIVQHNKDIEEQALLQAENQAKQNARESAIKKLADIAGLTKDELASIL
jgi:GR25 family glycosyltransferase involved in LPS biosynthesis